MMCETCGTLVSVIKQNGPTLACCGNGPKELVAKSPVTEGKEKHLPVVEVVGQEVHVQVGSVLHPMVEDHWIEWIYLVTDKGEQIKHLHPGEEPKAVFHIGKGEKVLEAYDYCNKHGLWKTVL